MSTVNVKSEGIRVSIDFSHDALINLLWEWQIPTTDDNISKLRMALIERESEIASVVFKVLLHDSAGDIVSRIIMETFKN
jgi:hypothetical protein